TPSPGRFAESGKERSAFFPNVLLVGTPFMVNRQQEIAIGELNRLRSDHQSFYEGNNFRVAPAFCSILRILVFDDRIGPGFPIAAYIKQPRESAWFLPN